jgi:hypothetical protein
MSQTSKRAEEPVITVGTVPCRVDPKVPARKSLPIGLPGGGNEALRSGMSPDEQGDKPNPEATCQGGQSAGVLKAY